MGRWLTSQDEKNIIDSIVASRSGDQVALANINSAFYQARKGNPKSLEAVKLVQRFTAANPVGSPVSSFGGNGRAVHHSAPKRAAKPKKVIHHARPTHHENAAHKNQNLRPRRMNPYAGSAGGNGGNGGGGNAMNPADAAGAEVTKAAAAIAARYGVDPADALASATGAAGSSSGFGMDYGQELSRWFYLIAQDAQNPAVSNAALKEEIKRQFERAFPQGYNPRLKYSPPLLGVARLQNMAAFNFNPRANGGRSEIPHAVHEILMGSRPSDFAGEANFSGHGAGAPTLHASAVSIALNASAFGGDLSDPAALRHFAQAVKLSHTREVTPELVREFAAEFGTDDAREMFFSGVENPTRRIKASPVLSRVGAMCIRSGQCVGLAGMLQRARTPGASLATFSPKAYREIGTN